MKTLPTVRKLQHFAYTSLIVFNWLIIGPSVIFAIHYGMKRAGVTNGTEMSCLYSYATANYTSGIEHHLWHSWA